MKKMELSKALFDAGVTMEAAIWVGGIDIDSPPDMLERWAEDGMLEGLCVSSGDECVLDGFLAKHEFSMPFIAAFAFPVPYNFSFGADGSFFSCSMGGMRRMKVFVGEDVESCIKQACEWGKTEFKHYESKAREAAKKDAQT